jgi:histidinol-phosphate aminotransferase
MNRADERPDLSVLRDDVRSMAGYAVPDAAGLVKLDAMENPFGLPEDLQQRLATRLAAQPLNRYPMADPREFKERLRKAMGVPDGLRLMLGNGSDELIHLVIQACAKPDAVVLSPVPSFVMYEMSARFNRCRFVGVPLAPDFSLDMEAMLAAIETHRPAVTFLSYPNNPTGNLFDRGAVGQVIARCTGLVVVDEAYLPFAQDTWMPRVGRLPNLVVLRTLSKLGLAGIRLGYLAGHPDWIMQFEKVRPPYNVNVLTLAAADLMLENLPLLDDQAATLRAERARLDRSLDDTPGVTAFASAANFILFRVGNADEVFAGLKERGILIKNVSAMHPLLTGCLRVTVGTAAENEAFIKALRAVIRTEQ